MHLFQYWNITICNIVISVSVSAFHCVPELSQLRLQLPETIEGHPVRQTIKKLGAFCLSSATQELKHGRRPSKRRQKWIDLEKLQSEHCDQYDFDISEEFLKFIGYSTFSALSQDTVWMMTDVIVSFIITIIIINFVTKFWLLLLVILFLESKAQ